MFEPSQKQAVIVYRKKEDEFAHLMTNLISAFTEYEIAEWEEKDWLANKASISSAQKVIFLGDSQEAHKRYLGIAWIFNKLNMKYGWLGNQCILDIDPLSTTNIQEFCDYYQQKAQEFTAITESPLLSLPCEVFQEATPESADDSEVLEGEIVEVESSSDKNHHERLRSLVSKTYTKQKNNLVKLQSNATASIKNRIIIGKLVTFQYNLLILEFIFSGDLKKFMEG